MNEEKKKKWLASLDRRIQLFGIDLKAKLRKEPLKALACLALKAPSYLVPGGLKIGIKTFWGGMMYGILPDVISTQLYRNEYLEEGLTKMFLEYLAEGMTVADIGAHIGYFSVLASDIVGPQGQVHAFEPTDSTFAILECNAKHRKNIVANKLAVFSKSTDLEFRDFGNQYSNLNSFTEPKVGDGRKLEFRKTIVKAITLDEYVAETRIKPDFIKIDAESAEFEILKGAEKTIGNSKPIISLEVGETVSSDVMPSSECIKFLLSKGYTAHCYEGGKIMPHTVKDEYKWDNLLFVP